MTPPTVMVIVLMVAVVNVRQVVLTLVQVVVVVPVKDIARAAVKEVVMVAVEVIHTNKNNIHVEHTISKSFFQKGITEHAPFIRIIIHSIPPYYFMSKREL